MFISCLSFGGFFIAYFLIHTRSPVHHKNHNHPLRGGHMAYVPTITHVQNLNTENKTSLSLHGHDVGLARPMGVAHPTSCELLLPVRILRLPEVIERVGLCRASIYKHMAGGHFPRSISLGPRAVGWLEHEIEGWLQAKISARQCKGHIIGQSEVRYD
jgi:prophage regulatory protein